MVETQGVETKFTVDDKDFNAKMDNLERRLRNAEERAKKGGRATGGAFVGGVAGGVAGFVASSAAQSAPVNAITDLMLNVLGAALLPFIQGLMPVLQGIAQAVVKINQMVGNDGTAALGAVAAGAWAGSRFGPAGAAVGALAGAATTVGSGQGDLTPNYYSNDPMVQKYGERRDETRPDVPFWKNLIGIGNTGYGTDYEKMVQGFERNTPGSSLFENDQRTWQMMLQKGAVPAQEPGLPYNPNFPPPNVSELQGTMVVNP